MMRNDSLVSKVSLNSINIQEMNLTNLVPQQERSFPYYKVSESRFFHEMWFLTIDPFVGIPIFIAKLSKRQYCWRVFEDLHSQEYFQFFDPFQHHSGPFCCSYASTLRSPQQILVLQVLELMQAGTYFPETRRMLLFHALLI